MKKIRLTLFALATTLALAPLSYSPAADGALVRVTPVCGQAKECKSSTKYICSTVRKDHYGYRCTKGCKDAVL